MVISARFRFSATLLLSILAALVMLVLAGDEAAAAIGPARALPPLQP